MGLDRRRGATPPLRARAVLRLLPAEPAAHGERPPRPRARAPGRRGLPQAPRRRDEGARARFRRRPGTATRALGRPRARARLPHLADARPGRSFRRPSGRADNRTRARRARGSTPGRRASAATRVAFLSRRQRARAAGRNGAPVHPAALSALFPLTARAPPTASGARARAGSAYLPWVK